MTITSLLYLPSGRWRCRAVVFVAMTRCEFPVGLRERTGFVQDGVEELLRSLEADRRGRQVSPRSGRGASGPGLGGASVPLCLAPLWPLFL